MIEVVGVGGQGREEMREMNVRGETLWYLETVWPQRSRICAVYYKVIYNSTYTPFIVFTRTWHLKGAFGTVSQFG